MSQPVSDPKPNRYLLPATNMVGALVVLLLCIGAYVGFRALVRDNRTRPPQSVEYASWARAGRNDHRLATLVPALPRGWRATSASYTSGVQPHWHLGVLTDRGRYVGVEESVDPTEDQVHQYVDEQADAGPVVRIAGRTWRSWTDSGGDYAVSRRQAAPRGNGQETVLVVGSAPPRQVRAYAASLSATRRP